MSAKLGHNSTTGNANCNYSKVMKEVVYKNVLPVHGM
jgi:hypothetical protein